MQLPHHRLIQSYVSKKSEYHVSTTYNIFINYCRLGSQSSTAIPTIRMTESGLANISNFYPVSSVDLESGLNSTREVVDANLDNTETLNSTT